LFRAPGHFSLFRLSTPVDQRLAVGRYPLLRPFLAAAAAPLDFFIFELSRKHPRLLRYRRGTCAEVPLPAGVRTRCSKLEHFDRRITRWSIARLGKLAGRHGAASASAPVRLRSKAEYLAHYFLLIDRASGKSFQERATAG